MDERELFTEMNALLGAIAKAFDLQEEQVVSAVEAGEVAIEMQEDFRGERFLAVQYLGRRAQIYQGAILHQPQAASGPAG